MILYCNGCKRFRLGPNDLASRDLGPVCRECGLATEIVGCCPREDDVIDALDKLPKRRSSLDVARSMVTIAIRDGERTR